jgi:signal peptide peptidase SppA
VLVLQSRRMTRTANIPALTARLVGAPLAISQRGLDVLRAQIERGASAFSESTPKSEPQVTQDGIAVVSVAGVLLLHADEIDEYFGFKGYDAVEASIASALANRNVKAVLLDFNSPGGEVSGMLELAEKIGAWSSAKDGKPIHAFVDPMACSAAYALAAATSNITIPRTGDVGSVGILSMHLDQSGFDQKLGMKWSFIYAGAKKVDGNPHGPLSDTARADRQSEIDSVYGMFVKSVAANRDMPQRDVRDTEAGTFMGEAAVKAGFADQVGTLDDALAGLRAEINGRKAMSFQKSVAAKLAVLSIAADADESTIVAGIDKLLLSAQASEKKAHDLESGLKKAEESRAADRKAHAASVVELARKASAKSGVLLAADEAKDLEEMLANGSEREVRFAHRRIDECLAKSEVKTDGLRSVKPPEVEKKDEAIAESDRQVEAMLASRGIKPLSGKKE